MNFKPLLLILAAIFIGKGAPVDFARDVHPILVSRCSGCHTGERRQGGLSVNTRAELLKGGAGGAAIVAGESAHSMLMKRITGNLLPQMPMGAPPLTPAEIATLRTWIDEGAVWNPAATPGSRKASLALRKPKLSSIDEILNLKQEPVSDAIFLRRVYLDIWGLLPTPEERAQFLNDPSSDKRTKLIDHLLADRQNYAEHWISFWNDLLHNDEGVTYIGDRRTITPWLLTALKENLPYDKFVSELLNPQPKTGPEGFLIGVNWRGDVNASQTPVMQAAQNSAQVFLGVNLKCNSCHDSFISSWKLKDAYGLASFFSKDKLELVRCDIPTGKMSVPQFLYPELGGVPEDATLEERKAAAAKLFTTSENGRFARTFVNRIWRKLMGRGIVEPADDMDAKPFNEDLIDWLAWDFVSHNYDVNYLLRQIMTSRAYQLPATDSKQEFRGPQFRRLQAEQFVDAISSITGEWRVKAASKPTPGTYSRDWKLKTDPLARALGRPMRDLAITERLNDPTTLQTLEFVNGQSLATLLHLGALRLMGQSENVPSNIFDSGVVRGDVVKVDIDITGLSELRLLVVDQGSYDVEKVKSGWASAEFVRGKKTAALPPDGKIKPKKAEAIDAIVCKVPCELTYDIRGKGYKRFRAKFAVDETSLTSDVNASIRAFAFKETPNRRQLVRVEGGKPVPAPPKLETPDQIIGRIYQHALGRDPNDEERQIARELLKSGVPGLEDFLWAIFLSPEFQFIS
jgi:hypothetical protein